MIALRNQFLIQCQACGFYGLSQSRIASIHAAPTQLAAQVSNPLVPKICQMLYRLAHACQIIDANIADTGKISVRSRIDHWDIDGRVLKILLHPVDGLGLTADLERNLAIALSGKRILILGAGGAVRGVLGPLMERDLGEVVIANRTPERARKLASEFADMGQISGCGFADIQGPPYDLIINATSASLQGVGSSSPKR